MASRWAGLAVSIGLLLLASGALWPTTDGATTLPLAAAELPLAPTASAQQSQLRPIARRPRPQPATATPTHITIALPLLDQRYGDASGLQAGVALIRAMWQEWGRVNSTAVTFVELSSAQALSALHQGRVQVVAAVPFTPQQQRQRLVHSLPYLAIRRPVFVRTPEQSGAGRLAVFTSDPQLTYYPDLLERQSTGPTLAVLATSDISLSDYDRIATLRPLELAGALAQAGLTAHYRYSDDELRPLPLRALTTARHSAVMQSFNRLLRQTDEVRLQQLWPHQGSSQTTLVMPLVSQLLPTINVAQEQFVANHPVIYYGTTALGYPPYVIPGPLDDRGYAIDLLDQVGYRLGVEFRPRYFPTLAALLPEIKRDTISLLPVTHSDRPAPGFALTRAYDHQQQVLVVRSEHLITPPAELLQQIEVVVRDSPGAALTRPPSSQIMLVDTAAEAFAMVNDGLASFLRAEPVHASYMVSQGNFANLALRAMPDHSGALGDKRMLVNDHQPELLALLEAGLNSISDGEHQQLRTKWAVNTAIALAEQHDLRSLRQRVVIGVTVGVAVGGLLLLWQQLLLKRRRRTQWQIESALAEARKARDEAEQQAQAKSLFMAKMSHEIRTPMNGVLGMAEALQATPINDEQQELLATLNSSARNLLALLNDVLDYSKMEADQLVIEQIPFDLHQLCRHVISNYHHRAASSGLSLNLNVCPGEPLQFVGDPTRLTQILNNLVSNALKFTHAGRIDLGVTVVGSGADGRRLVELSVRDSGIGIAPQHLDALFTPFTQADASTTRRYGGTGLGLTICRELVTAMGGTISVASAPGLGSLFTIQLPLAPAVAPPSATAPAASDSIEALRELLANGPPLQLLVAEDNAVNLHVLTRQLRRLGIEATTAGDGAEALRLHQQHAYHLLLSDCHMPGMDGFALAAAISSQRQDHRPYLLALTADAQSGAADRCLAAGFDGYIAKPCPLPELARQLLQALIQLGWPAPVTSDEPPLAVASDDHGPAAAANRPDPSLPLIDRPLALALVGDDVEVMAAILDAYLDHQQQDRDALSEAVTAADDQHLRALVHRIKGSLRYLGATAAANLAAAIEQGLDDGEPDARPLALPLLEQLARVATEVERWRLELSPPATGAQP